MGIIQMVGFGCFWCVSEGNGWHQTQ